MSKVSFKYGTASQLTNAPYSDGTFYVISDSGSTNGILYADLNNKRICFGDVASLIEDVSDLEATIPTKISELTNDSGFIKQYYGTCATAAATVQKEVTINNITELTTGLTIFVKFTYANTATDPTLKLNNFDAKAIKRYGTTAPGTSAASSWNANGLVALTYDGTYWCLNDWNNTTYSAMSESEMQTGTATTARNITAARLKQAIEYHAPVSSVNGQTGEVSISIPTVPTNVSDFTNDAGYLTSYTETDPTVPSWAKQSTKPTYTATEVGALPDTTTIPSKTSDLTNDSGYLTQETDPTIHILVLQEDENEKLTTGEDDSISNYINNNELVIIYYDGIPHFYDKNSDRGYSFNGINGNYINYLYYSGDNKWYWSTGDNEYYIKSYDLPTNVSQLDNDAGYITQETDPTVPSWAKASTKPSYNFSEIGSTPTTISGYGITDAYTKTQVDGLVAGVLHYKGTKAAVSNLPTSGNTTGDTWHVTADGSEWAWDGTTWQELGTAVDLSDYVTTDDSRLSDARTPTAHNQALSTITGADDLKAIEALSGTSGLLKKTAANTWSLDTNTYMQTSHAANGITSNDITNWNNKLSSYTETDPVFTASAAANISSTDISNWNSKTSNTGTVTSIGLSNATNGGLTVSNSPVTNSGNITVGHSNVLSSAQTTQAVYPIKIDKNGHISAYGSAVSIPTKVSDLTNDSGFISSYTETDPVFSASAAAGISSSDISNWNAKVSDDKTWNNYVLEVTNEIESNNISIPWLKSNTESDKRFKMVTASSTPHQYYLAKYDISSYLYSTTPSANDNSTKVATTAYVDAAIPNVSNYVSKSGDTMSGRLTLAYSSGSTNGHQNGGLEFTGNNNTFVDLHSAGYSGTTSDYTMKLKFESGGSNSSNGVILQGIASPSNSTDAANKAYVDSTIPQVYSSNNTSGYLTMATLPIYDGTVV